MKKITHQEKPMINVIFMAFFVISSIYKKNDDAFFVMRMNPKKSTSRDDWHTNFINYCIITIGTNNLYHSIQQDPLSTAIRAIICIRTN